MTAAAEGNYSLGTTAAATKDEGKLKLMSAARKILVVDDDIDIVKIVSTMLAGRGWEVATASSGEEALREVRRDPPDLILLDIMMPRMNGLEVLRQVREI